MTRLLGWCGRHTALLVLAITLLVNVPYLLPQMAPTHDTLNALIYFHFTYSELFFQGELPRWNPFIGYGVPFDVSLFNCIQPTDYPVMAVGCLLRVHDAALLFKLSCILSQGIFVLGLYLLARKLIVSRLVLWLVCLSAILTQSWTWSIQWNLTSYYMLPWVLWFLLRFLETGKPAQLWLAGMVEMLSLLGTIPYIVPVHFLILLTFLCCWRPSFFPLLLRWRNFVHPLFFVFAGCACLLGFYVFDMLKREVILLTPGRSTETAAVPLDMFLEMSRNPWGAKMAMMVRGDVPSGDMVLYIGLLPLAGLAYGLVRRRDAAFAAIAALAFVLFWFNAGGWFTTATYYCVPLMNRFRHIGHILDTAKVFLLLLGGMGLDRLLQDLDDGERSCGHGVEVEVEVKAGKTTLTLAISLLACAAIDVGCHLTPADFGYSAIENEDLGVVDSLILRFLVGGRFLAFAAFFGVSGWLLAKRPIQGQAALRWALPVLCLADVGAFYLLVLECAPFCTDSLPVGELFQVRPLRYTPERLPAFFPLRPGASETESTIDFFFTPRGSQRRAAFYASMQFFCRVDPYWPQLRLDTMTPGVKKMIEVRGGKVGQVRSTDDVNRVAALLRQELTQIAQSPDGRITQQRQATAEQILKRGVPGFSPVILPNDVPFLESLGYKQPKMHIVHNPVYASSQAEAIARFAEQKDPFHTPVLICKPPLGGVANGSDLAERVAEPSHFSANRVVIEVALASPGWLVYADALHPGWKATVNGEPADVVCANLGFKAVHIDKGQNEVAFYFDDGLYDWVRDGFALFGGILGSVMVGLLVVMPWREREDDAACGLALSRKRQISTTPERTFTEVPLAVVSGEPAQVAAGVKKIVRIWAAAMMLVMLGLMVATIAGFSWFTMAGAGLIALALSYWLTIDR